MLVASAASTPDAREEPDEPLRERERARVVGNFVARPAAAPRGARPPARAPCGLRRCTKRRGVSSHPRGMRARRHARGSGPAQCACAGCPVLCAGRSSGRCLASRRPSCRASHAWSWTWEQGGRPTRYRRFTPCLARLGVPRTAARRQAASVWCCGSDFRHDGKRCYDTGQTRKVQTRVERDETHATEPTGTGRRRAAGPSGAGASGMRG